MEVGRPLDRHRRRKQQFAASPYANTSVSSVQEIFIRMSQNYFNISPVRSEDSENWDGVV